jgi:uncharacterized protein (TIGR00255 family)
MLRSMTGFGAARATVGAEELFVELRSVNAKFCEVKVRTPRELSTLEAGAAKVVRDRLSRGTIDLSVKRTGRAAGGAVPTVDVALAKEYRRALGEVARAAGLADEVTVREVALMPNVIRLEEAQVNLEDAQRALDQALAQALTALTQMREAEGKAISADLLARLALVERLVTEIGTWAPKVVEAYRDRLAERVAELTRGGTLDPQRLAQEVALLADRTDVAEELTRLSSHVAQFRTLIAAQEPSGRKMDFLVQEMHREVNTTGSKSQHVEISQRVVTLKAELERIREQVQNVE